MARKKKTEEEAKPEQPKEEKSEEKVDASKPSPEEPTIEPLPAEESEPAPKKKT